MQKWKAALFYTELRCFAVLCATVLIVFEPLSLICWTCEASPLGKTEPASILTVKKNDSAIPTARLSMVSKANTVAFRTGCLPVSPVVRIISTETSITWFHACKLWQQRCIRKGGIVFEGVTAGGCLSKKAGSRIRVFWRSMISQRNHHRLFLFGLLGCYLRLGRKMEWRAPWDSQLQ